MRGLAAALLALTLSGAAAAQEFYTLKGHGGPIMDIAVDPISSRIATASFDNSVGLWSGRTPAWLEGHDAAVNCVVFLADGRAVSAGDDFALILWDPAADTSRRLDGHRGKVTALAVSPDGATIASASWDGTIGLWPLDGGPPQFLSGHSGGVNDVAFGPGGTRLYSASADGTIRVWSLDTAQDLVLVNNGFGINRLVLDPQSGWLAYGSVDGVTRVVDIENGRQIADFSLERRPILAMATDVGQRHIAVGDGHGFIMVIDSKRWRIAHDFRATLRGPIWALAFSADGRTIHAGGIEDIVYSWPVAALDSFEPVASEPRSFLQAPETMTNGERQFKRKCSICHALAPGPTRRAGPNLFGVFGRRAGSLPGYLYSSTLEGSSLIWTEKTIDALFDQGPDHFIPGSKMPMQRIAEDQDRADLIAYLKARTKTAEN